MVGRTKKVAKKRPARKSSARPPSGIPAATASVAPASSAPSPPLRRSGRAISKIERLDPGIQTEAEWRRSNSHRLAMLRVLGRRNLEQKQIMQAENNNLKKEKKTIKSNTAKLSACKQNFEKKRDKSRAMSVDVKDAEHVQKLPSKVPAEQVRAAEKAVVLSRNEEKEIEEDSAWKPPESSPYGYMHKGKWYPYPPYCFPCYHFPLMPPAAPVPAPYVCPYPNMYAYGYPMMQPHCNTAPQPPPIPQGTTAASTSRSSEGKGKRAVKGD